MARVFVLSVRSSGRAAPPSGRAFALSVLEMALCKAAATAQQRVEIVEGVVQAATANIQAVCHKMDDMALSESGAFRF